MPALIAGNVIILKPSEKTPHTSRFLARLVKEVFRLGGDIAQTRQGQLDARLPLLAKQLGIVAATWPGTNCPGTIAPP